MHNAFAQRAQSTLHIIKPYKLIPNSETKYNKQKYELKKESASDKNIINFSMIILANNYKVTTISQELYSLVGGNLKSSQY